MLLPSIFGESLFDSWRDFPRFFDETERKLYGKNAAHLMNTDVRDHDNRYEIDIDLPGFKKDEITLDLENGCLIVSASKKLDNSEKSDEGKVIRRERYAGAMQRSFYVGKEITAEDIKAKFEAGVLKLALPKKETQKLPEKKAIMIEG